MRYGFSDNLASLIGDAAIGDAPLYAGRSTFDPSLHPAKSGDFVLVWMQKAQRSRDNPALDLGFHLANRLRLPLLVLFVRTYYPGAQAPHYRFMLEGLRECAADLRSRGALFCIDSGEMVPTVLRHARNAALLVADEGKLAFERRWREQIAAGLASAEGFPPLILVETESVIPPFAVSDHLEWSAATIRRKISAKLPFYLTVSNPVRESLPECHVCARADHFPSRDELFDAEPPIAGRPLPLQRIRFTPGQGAGMARFAEFLESGGLERYESSRNDPFASAQSEMSPYLHFGQVSPVTLAWSALEHSERAAQAFIEQLVVRRELALNYVLYSPGYDRYESAVPDWARKSLSERGDRETLYSLPELEAGKTADPFWNAAQKEMLLTGKMHNYLRMYWGKKLLSWFSDPAEAFGVALRLNDAYSIDGRDPNGYAGVAWCFGRHDRPWPTRPLFGAVRSMTASGLCKKFDVERYATEVEGLYTKRIKEIS